MKPYWYVVHCQSRKEWQTASALRALSGVDSYLPEVRRRYQGEVQIAPLFPRYLFIRANLEEVPPSRINRVSGVCRLLTSGDGFPQPVPERVIADLMEREEQINAQGGLLDHGFQPGDTVRMKKGPFSGLEAVFEGPMEPNQRVHILLEFMGRINRIDVDVDMLERSVNAPEPAPEILPKVAPRRERRTRGKGRKINRRNDDA